MVRRSFPRGDSSVGDEPMVAPQKKKEVTFELDDYATSRKRRGKLRDQPPLVNPAEDEAMEPVVDSKENPTQLFLRINYRLWEMAATSLMDRPEDARVWISSNDSSASLEISRNLPIHLACQRGAQPVPRQVFQALLAAYPGGARKKNMDGDLPIHLACRNKGLLQKDGEFALKALVEYYPESVSVKDSQNRTPKDILESYGDWRLGQCVKTVSVDEAIVESEWVTMRPTPGAESRGFADQLNRLRLAQLSPSSRHETRDPSVFFSPKESRSPLDEQFTGVVGSAISGAGEPNKITISGPGDDPPSIRDPPEPQAMREASDVSVLRLLARTERELEMKLSKATAQNENLRDQLSTQTQQSLSFKSEANDKIFAVRELQEAIESERQLHRQLMLQKEERLASLEHELNTTKNELSSKATFENSLRRSLDDLQLKIAVLNEDTSAYRMALADETASKEAIAKKLKAKEDQSNILLLKLEGAKRDADTLAGQIEQMNGELEWFRSQEEQLMQKDGQVVALIQARKLDGERNDRLEKMNGAMKGKLEGMRATMRRSTEASRAGFSKLEENLAIACAERDTAKDESVKALEEIVALKKLLSSTATEKKDSQQRIAELETERMKHKDIVQMLNQRAQESDSLQSSLKAMSAKMDDLALALNQKEELLVSKSKEVDMLMTDLHSTEGKVASLTEKLSSSQRESTEAKLSQEKARSDLTEAHGRATALNSTVDTLREEIAQLISSKSSDKRQLDEMVEKVAAADLRAGASEQSLEKTRFDLARMSDRVQSLLNEKSMMEKDLQERSNELQVLRDQVRGLECQVSELSSSCNNYETSLQQRNGEIEHQRSEIVRLSECNRMHVERIEELKTEKDRARPQSPNTLFAAARTHIVSSFVEQRRADDDSLAADIAGLRDVIAELHEKNVALSTQISQLKDDSRRKEDSELLRQRDVIDTLRAEASSSRDAIEAMRAANETLANENRNIRENQLQEKSEYLKSISDLEAEIQKGQIERDRICFQLDEAKTEMKKVQIELDCTRKRAGTVTEANEGSSKQISKLKAEAILRTEHLKANETERERISTKLDEARTELKRIQMELEATRDRVGTLTEANEVSTQEISKLKAEAILRTELLKTRQTERERSLSELDEARTELKSAQIELEATRNRVGALTEANDFLFKQISELKAEAIMQTEQLNSFRDSSTATVDELKERLQMISKKERESTLKHETEVQRVADIELENIRRNKQIALAVEVSDTLARELRTELESALANELGATKRSHDQAQRVMQLEDELARNRRTFEGSLAESNANLEEARMKLKETSEQRDELSKTIEASEERANQLYNEVRRLVSALESRELLVEDARGQLAATKQPDKALRQANERQAEDLEPLRQSGRGMKDKLIENSDVSESRSLRLEREMQAVVEKEKEIMENDVETNKCAVLEREVPGSRKQAPALTENPKAFVSEDACRWLDIALARETLTSECIYSHLKMATAFEANVSRLKQDSMVCLDASKAVARDLESLMMSASMNEKKVRSLLLQLKAYEQDASDSGPCGGHSSSSQYVSNAGLDCLELESTIETTVCMLAEIRDGLAVMLTKEKDAMGCCEAHVRNHLNIKDDVVKLKERMQASLEASKSYTKELRANLDAAKSRCREGALFNGRSQATNALQLVSDETDECNIQIPSLVSIQVDELQQELACVLSREVEWKAKSDMYSSLASRVQNELKTTKTRMENSLEASTAQTAKLRQELEDALLREGVLVERSKCQASKAAKLTIDLVQAKQQSALALNESNGLRSKLNAAAKREEELVGRNESITDKAAQLEQELFHVKEELTASLEASNALTNELQAELESVKAGDIMETKTTEEARGRKVNELVASQEALFNQLTDANAKERVLLAQTESLGMKAKESERETQKLREDLVRSLEEFQATTDKMSVELANAFAQEARAEESNKALTQKVIVLELEATKVAQAAQRELYEATQKLTGKLEEAEKREKALLDQNRLLVADVHNLKGRLASTIESFEMQRNALRKQLSEAAPEGEVMVGAEIILSSDEHRNEMAKLEEQSSQRKGTNDSQDNGPPDAATEEAVLRSELCNQKAKVKALEKANRDLQDQLAVLDDKSTAYHGEIGSLLKTNASLQANLEQVIEKTKEYKERIKKLERLIQRFEQEEVPMRVSKVASGPETENSKQNEKSPILREYDLAEIPVLEEKIQEMTTTHDLLLEEADGLKDTITDQGEKIIELEDVIGNLKREKERLGTMASMRERGDSMELWLPKVVELVNQYSGLDPLEEEKGLRGSVVCNRLSQILRRLTEQPPKKAAELIAANRALRLENKLLKTTCKEHHARAASLQGSLQKENTKLRVVLSRLARQNVDHKEKLRQLAANQTSLQRKKASVAKGDEQQNVQWKQSSGSSTNMGSVELVLVNDTHAKTIEE